MNLSRIARTLFAGRRRGLAGALGVTFAVLTVVGGQVLCGVHLDGAGHSHPHSHTVVAQHLATPSAAASVEAAAPHGTAGTHHAADEAPGHHHDGGAHDCAEGRTDTARYERTTSPSLDVAGGPVLAVRWWVPDVAHHQLVTASGVAVAAAPSLHALGISRT